MPGKGKPLIFVGDGRYVDGKDVGTPVPISLKVYSLPDNKLVTEREITTNNTYAWSKDWIARKIGTLSLPPGYYKINIQVKEDVSSFKHFETTVNMGLAGEFSSSTWQMTYIIWAGFLEPLVWVVDILLSIIVAYKRVKAKTLYH